MVPDDPLHHADLPPEIDKNHDFLNQLFVPIREYSKNMDVSLSTILSRYCKEILKTDGEATTEELMQINFTEAALVVQGSATIYSKKVEFLYTLACQLLQYLHDEKKKGCGSSKNKDKDVLLTGRHNNDEFTADDDIKYQPNSNKLNEDLKTAQRRYFQTFITRTPLALITLSESEKGDITLATKTGEVFGNRNDYNMNICRRDEDGFLSLPTLNCAGLPDQLSELSNLSISLSSQIENQSVIDDDDYGGGCVDDFTPMDCQDNSEDAFPVEDNPQETPIKNALPLADNLDISIPDAQGNDAQEMAECASSPLPEIDEDIIVPMRRKSARQANKQLKIASKQKEAEAEAQKRLWSKDEDPENDIIVPIKKNTEKKPRRVQRQKRSNGRDSRCSTEIVNDALLNGKRALDHQKVCLDSKLLKKMPQTVEIDVNTAYELLFVKSLQSEKAAADELRKKLASNSDKTPNLAIDDGFDDVVDDFNHDDDDNDEIADHVAGDDVGNLAEHNPSENVTPDSGLLSSPVQNTSSSSCENELSFEGILRAHVDNYMKEADKLTETCDLSERVKKWEDKIKPILQEESRRESFDIHLYGTRIIDCFENNNRKQSIPFSKVVAGKKPWEISRYFLSVLVLANNNNVEISWKNNSSGMHDVDLTLLSRKRHQEQLDAFGHSSGEH